MTLEEESMNLEKGGLGSTKDVIALMDTFVKALFFNKVVIMFSS